MIRAFRNNTGFTIIEFSLVLVALGILAAVLVPMTQAVHEDAMREQDENTLQTARDALMGYIRVNQAIPCVADLGAGPEQIIPFGPLNPTTACDPTLTLDLLGVRTTDSRTRAFALDVNNDLTVEGIAASGMDLCAALANIISPVGPPTPPPTLDPQLCEAVNANTGSAACTPATTPTMAFVLAGRGSDRCFNLENSHDSAVNDPVCPTAVANNRVFENPVRLQSRTVDDGYYDDLMLTVTPTELAEVMGCPLGGGGSTFPYCPPGEKLVQVLNGHTAGYKSVDIAGTCYGILGGTTGGPGCQLESNSIEVWSNSNCGGTLHFSGTVASLDTNGDGRTDILCDRTGNCISN